VPGEVGWGTSLLRGTANLVGLDLGDEAIEYARRHYADKVEFEVGDCGISLLRMNHSI